MQEPEQIDLDIQDEDDNVPQFIESEEDFVCFDDLLDDSSNDQNQS